MKTIFCAIFLVFVCSLAIVPAQKENNDFYDNTPFIAMEGIDIEVAGEVVNPGKVDFKQLPLRTLNVSEAVVTKDGQKFVGSYTYRGYSLFDIIKERFVDKKNEKEFESIIDLLVSVENKQGGRVVLSWGEIYYPTALHRILVATEVARIVPSRTKEQWPLPRKAKLVCGNDLFANRNIESPAKITVFALPMSFKVDRGLDPLYSGAIAVYKNGEKAGSIEELDKGLSEREYPSVFYGRGKGFHGIKNFKGNMLRQVLAQYMDVNDTNLQKVYLAVAAADGYRVAISFAELFNRNDQAEFLIYATQKNEDAGRFKLFPAPDFFSDRAVKAISSIHFLTVD